jgi:hypothetical protein
VSKRGAHHHHHHHQKEEEEEEEEEEAKGEQKEGTGLLTGATMTTPAGVAALCGHTECVNLLPSTDVPLRMQTQPSPAVAATAMVSPLADLTNESAQTCQAAQVAQSTVSSQIMPCFNWAHPQLGPPAMVVAAALVMACAWLIGNYSAACVNSIDT